jgi:hypothetical protein
VSINTKTTKSSCAQHFDFEAHAQPPRAGEHPGIKRPFRDANARTDRRNKLEMTVLRHIDIREKSVRNP